jgi:hypothetical protein
VIVFEWSLVDHLWRACDEAEPSTVILCRRYRCRLVQLGMYDTTVACARYLAFRLPNYVLLCAKRSTMNHGFYRCRRARAMGLSVRDPQSGGVAAIRPTGRIRKLIEAAILPIVRNRYRASCDTFGIGPSRIEEQR